MAAETTVHWNKQATRSDGVVLVMVVVSRCVVSVDWTM